VVNAIRAFKIPCPGGEGVNFLFGRFEGIVPAIWSTPKVPEESANLIHKFDRNHRHQ